LWIELIEPSGSGFDVGHETCILEHLEVLRYGGTGYGHGACQLVDGYGAVGELLKDRQAGCVGKGVQSSV